MSVLRRATAHLAAAIAAAALLTGAFAAGATAAPTCHLVGTWNHTTTDVGSTSWSITADGKAQETGIGNASGTASLSGGVLTINWTTGNGYAGTYRWTLQPNCSGTGTLTFTKVGPGDDRAGKSYSSTVTGPAPTEDAADGCGARIAGAHAAAVNEVRIVAVQPGVAFRKAGTPEDAWLNACKDTVLQQGDEISCDPDGAVTLQFADNSTVVVRNTTQLKIASFFTEGGVVKTEILLKMGEVAAQVHKSEATKSDFRIKTPVLDGGITRGTKFTAFYDPGTRSSLWAVTEGAVEVTSHTGAAQLVQAGREALVTPAGRISAAKIGKAGARGGLNLRNALAKVLKTVSSANGPCKITTPRENAFSVKPAPKGWAITVKVSGRLKGSSSWAVKSKRATPANGLAKRIAKRCR